MAKYDNVGGMKAADMEKIRELRGRIQTEVPHESVSMKDAVMWAVENELERLRDE